MEMCSQGVCASTWPGDRRPPVLEAGPAESLGGDDPSVWPGGGAGPGPGTPGPGAVPSSGGLR